MEVLVNDEAFARIMSINWFSLSTAYVTLERQVLLFDDVNLDIMLKISEITDEYRLKIGDTCFKFEKDYIKNVLPNRIDENRWELVNRGWLNRR